MHIHLQKGTCSKSEASSVKDLKSHIVGMQADIQTLAEAHLKAGSKHYTK